MIAALFFVRLCVLLRGLIIGNNPSQTECCFLVAEHSTSRMWAGWILYITLWYVPFGCMLSYKDHLRSTNIKSTFRKFIKYLRREQFRWRSSSQFFTMMMIWSKLSSYNLQRLKVVNTLARLNTHLVSICDHRSPNICLARKLTFGNGVSWIHHQAKGSTHVVGDIDNLLNKDNSPATSACDDFSINVPTPNILLSFSMESLNPATYPTTFIAHASTVGFNT
jgi:hypothetical protein